MKKLLCLAITIVLSCLIAGCLSTIAEKPTQHEITINVKAVEPTELQVATQPTVQMMMDVQNPEGSLSAMSFISNGEAFIKIFSALTVGDVTSLWNDLCVLEKATEIRTINLFINSPGGDAFQGLALADLLEWARRKGFHITARASGIVGSAAIPVFAVCEKRLATPKAIFMVHQASIWKWPGRETASDIRAQGNLMDLLRDTYLSILTEHSKLSREKWEEMEFRTTWFSAQQALEWGLVDRIE